MRSVPPPAAVRLVAWGNACLVWAVRRGDRRHNAVFWADHARQEPDQNRFDHAIQSNGFAIAADRTYQESYRPLRRSV